ncbi:MAG TPA: hypothetical protein VJJ23_04655 [Candidatus Nanoarchaeia archaeon]|nr:hypothetical protein [Candidatus Nanoarchaeia archaeon]
MSEEDFVVRNIEISQDAVFDLNDILKFLRDWFKTNGYGNTEKKHAEENKSGNLSLKLSWQPEKKVDEYVKFHINIDIKVKAKQVLVKNKKMYQGNVLIELEATMEKDYDDEWSGSITKKFVRGAYDKFVTPDKMSKYEKKLKEDVKDLQDEIKSYLNLVKEK